ncbi:ABC transporter substrate-binding protein [Rhizobium cauense]|uniref:ABC transporter substrate-binding protein n=1 Tax=Rhizobium cauense TaxID=1166683 RepID=UPI001C6F1133|nr:ABC transporter substrate-binding protein [Rhizobium cauense]MBW9113460.1 ABC transporter substrate-binding protein [Rhizobium cauense]
MPRLISATIALSLVTASTLSAPPAFAGKADDTLVATFAAQLPSLDRFYAPGREGFLLGLLIYDTLIYRDTQTFELKPLLATDWKWIDEKTLELHLRKGVMFHNGDSFTARDVAYTFNFAADPKNKVFDRITSAWVEKVEVVDDYTVRFHASKVTPLALQYIVQVPMMPAGHRDKVGLQAFSEQPIGTGPYKVVGKQGSDIVFERFDNYFDGGPKSKPAIKTLVYRTIPDVNTQVAELARGGVDWAWYIPTDQAERLAAIPTVTAVNAPTFRIGFLTMDAAGLAMPDGPLRDVRVRQAINYAIDRQAIARTLVGGSAEAIRTACNPIQFGCEQDVKNYAYDPQKAKQLLAEVGHGDGFDIDIYGFRSRPVAEAIVGYLGAVGIRANLVWQQYSAVVQQRRDRKAALVIDDFGSSGIADAGAPTKFYFNGAPDDQSRDAEVDAALEKAGSTNDGDSRKQAFSVAFKRIADQAYWAPLFTMPINYVMSSELEGPVPKDENVEFWKYHWK